MGRLWQGLDEALDADDPYRREGGTHLKYGTSTILVELIIRFRLGIVQHLLPDLLCRAIRSSTVRLPMRGQLC